METDITQKTSIDTVSDLGPSKKTWMQPDIILIEKQIIEGQSSPANDGGGVSTSS